MPLSDLKAKHAKAKPQPYKLTDEKGLYLLVNAVGKYWRMNYRFGGKQKTLALGVYPEVPLASRVVKDGETGTSRKIKGARELRDDARTLLEQKVDPGEVKRLEKLANTLQAENSFEAVAREWYGKFSAAWTAHHAAKTLRFLERDVFPILGVRPIGEITAPELLAMLRKVEARGTLETAHRVHQTCGRVFRYGVATGRCARDPAADLRGAIPPQQQVHRASITDPVRIGDLLRAIDGYDGSPITKAGLQLAALTFVRPGELRKAEWSEFDLDGAEWRIPAVRMKMREQHIVPLAKQAVAILKELQKLTGAGKFVFPGARTNGRPMSENTLNAALRRLDYGRDEMTAHGFRSMASTRLNEQGWHRDAIERQLAHAERDGVRAAYNYAEHLPERRRMMQHWANCLDGLRTGATVLPIRAKVRK